MEYKKLGEICRLRQGFQVPVNEQSTEYREGYVRFLRIVDYTQNTDDIRYVPDNPKYYCVKPDDIVMVRYGAAGEIGFGIEGVIANNLFLIEPIIPINKKFLIYYLSQKKIKTELSSKSSSTAMPAINFKTVKNIDIPILSLEKQAEIVSKLDKINSVITLLKNKLTKFDELVKARYDEMFRDKGYSSLKWNDVFNTTTGKLDSNAMVENGKYPFFTCAKEVYRIDKYAFNQEALLLAGNNAAGKYDVKYYNGKFNAYQRTYVLTLKENWSYQLFRYQLDDKLLYLQQRSLGGITKYLTLKILGTLEFIIPPVDEQFRFESFANSVENSKALVQKEIEKFQLLFDSITKEYFG